MICHCENTIFNEHPVQKHRKADTQTFLFFILLYIFVGSVTPLLGVISVFVGLSQVRLSLDGWSVRISLAEKYNSILILSTFLKSGSHAKKMIMGAVFRFLAPESSLECLCERYMEGKWSLIELLQHPQTQEIRRPDLCI